MARKPKPEDTSATAEDSLRGAQVPEMAKAPSKTAEAAAPAGADMPPVPPLPQPNTQPNPQPGPGPSVSGDGGLPGDPASEFETITSPALPGPALIITGPKKGRWRAGRQFGPQPVSLLLAALTAAERTLLESDPALTVTLVDAP